MHRPHATRYHRLQYVGVYLASFLVCWGSLALVISIGGKYLSVLSWNLFGLEELYRYYSRAERALVAPATIIPAAAVAIGFSETVWMIRSPKLRLAGIIVGVMLLLATLVWFPNPWENM